MTLPAINSPVTSPHGVHAAPVGVALYEQLMSLAGEGDPFDRHVLASAITRAQSDPERGLCAALGLDTDMLSDMLNTCFSGWTEVLGERAIEVGDTDELAVEEADFRRLLLSHRSAWAPVETWLAHILVRRSLCPDHLWSNLGVRSRKELSQTLFRHFGPLAEKNVNDMRWKKFFYRQMCQTEGVVVCKSPVCDTCTDYAECFSTGD